MVEVVERGLISLKISRHPRGHIADCNGSIEAVGANVESCSKESNNSNKAQLEALMAERRLYQKLISQSQQVEVFQRKVKERIKKRMKESSLDDLLSHPPPPVAVERHKHSMVSEPPKLDCERDVRIARGRNDRQRAVQKLLSVSEYCGKTSGVDITDSDEQERTRIGGMKVMESWESVPNNPKPIRKKPSPFLPADKVKLAQRQELAAQHLAVRRMYSAIERQQSRADAERRQLQSCVNKLKDKRERERRIIEEEGSFLSGDDEDEKQRWLETIALERRYHKLQKEKEMDRYFEALHEQIKEKMPDLPSLCPCHSSLWTSDPNLCARNCQFYQNNSKFASALKSFLKSVS